MHTHNCLRLNLFSRQISEEPGPRYAICTPSTTVETSFVPIFFSGQLFDDLAQGKFRLNCFHRADMNHALHAQDECHQFTLMPISGIQLTGIKIDWFKTRLADCPPAELILPFCGMTLRQNSGIVARSARRTHAH